MCLRQSAMHFNTRKFYRSMTLEDTLHLRKERIRESKRISQGH